MRRPYISLIHPDLEGVGGGEGEGKVIELRYNIYPWWKEQRGSELDTERSSSPSSSISGGISSASSVLGYNSNLYSDQEGPESDNQLQFDEHHRTELYDSLLSLNTVIENPSSRLTLHDDCVTQSLIEQNDSLTLSIPRESGVGSDVTITELNVVGEHLPFCEEKFNGERKGNDQPDLPNVDITMGGEYTSEEPSLLTSEVSTEHLYLNSIAAVVYK